MDAFNINLRKEYSRFVKPILSKNKGNAAAIQEALSASEDIHFPIFVCENNGETYYVLSASGKGLWDDVWGYVGFKSDASTVNGIPVVLKFEPSYFTSPPPNSNDEPLNEPRISIEPVRSCKSSDVSPNFVDPLS